jgi:hypothetical protein
VVEESLEELTLQGYCNYCLKYTVGEESVIVEESAVAEEGVVANESAVARARVAEESVWP